MDSECALLALRLHIDMSPPHLNTRSNTAARRAACVFQVPPNDMWGNPEVATLTTVWVEELQKELPAVEIADEEFEYGTHTWLLHLCHDCGHHECTKLVAPGSKPLASLTRTSLSMMITWLASHILRNSTSMSSQIPLRLP